MPKDVLEMNSAELRALKLTLNDENSTPQQREALNDRITEVAISEGVARGLEGFKRESTLIKNDSATFKRWPALKDKESEFYKQVEQRLKDRGDDGTDPYAFSDSADAVGIALGLAPDGWVPSQETAGILGIKGGGHQNAGEKGDGNDYLAENKEILDDLVKKGLLDPSNEASMERIRQAAEEKANG